MATAKTAPAKKRKKGTALDRAFYRKELLESKWLRPAKVKKYPGKLPRIVKRNWRAVANWTFFAFDTETTGLYPWQGDRPFAFSFCNRDGETAYLEFPVHPYTRKPIISKKYREFLRKIFLDPRRQVVLHNAKFDIRMVELSLNIKWRCRVHDTRFAAQMADSREGDGDHLKAYKLKVLSEKYLGIPRDDEEELKRYTNLSRTRARKMGFKIGVEYNWIPECEQNKVSTEADYWLVAYFYPHRRLCEKYAVEDARRTMLLWLMYEDMMVELNVRRKYDEEMQLWRVVYDMETRGVMLDRDHVMRKLRSADEDAARELAELQKHIHGDKARERRWHRAFPKKKGKEKFNPNSHTQLRWLIYQELKLPVEYLTKAPKHREDFHVPQPSTNWEVLTKHSDIPILATLIRYRSNTKNVAAFLEQYMALMRPDPLTWREHRGYAIHPSFNQCGPTTGRFSSSDPNLQNVSYGQVAMSRGTVPFTARVLFQPRPGYVWLFFDYKQLEARLFASCAEEPTMLAAFREGRDFHSEACNLAWGYSRNPEGFVRRAKYNLQIDTRGIPPSEPARKIWEEFDFVGLKYLKQLERGIPLPEKIIHSKSADFIAEMMAERFNGDVIKFEASLGLENSRAMAKALLFARIFGGGAKSIARHVNCPMDEAQEFLDTYSEEFPRINEFMKEMEREGRRNGCIYNDAGRRLTINARFAYRATNYRIQSLAADLLKRSMRRMHKYLTSRGLDAYLVATIHDELVVEVSEEYLNPYVTREYTKEEKPYIDCTSPLVSKLKRIMENNAGWVKLDTPVDVDFTRKTWADKIGVKLTAA